KPGGAQSNQNSHRTREQTIAPSEDLRGGLWGVMQQKFGAPIEKISLAGVQFGSALVFANRGERIAEFLLDIGKRVMKFGSVLVSQQRQQMVALFLVIACLGCGRRGLA